ncbi:PHD finger protein At1g33420 isoform X2 [Cryptomeria japonica]|uniref:PHD finger protein At1g33420 isoform X2 n=1 Tax=Cryptomeria japonica TaxID=3369 RepID=UPI0027DA1C6C|nr:PHD finger protein At1g33420 isoform X2 [Cryptomeria japonica]
MVVSRPMKRLKRVVAEADTDSDSYSFYKFGDGDRERFQGPFRSNVRSFLESYAEGPLALKISSPPLVQRWKIGFRLDDDNICVALNVVEERVAGEEQQEEQRDLDQDQDQDLHCSHCRLAGWNGNPVCNRRCKVCDYEISKETDLEEESQLALEDSSHLLHGIIHANGFGHLLRVNGREGGSQFLSGCDIMSLWDRICIMLRARKISVMDVSKKYGLEYRLLHAVQKGHPWYGNWGYEFATGSFALTFESYKTAVECLSRTPLISILSGVGKYNGQLKCTVQFYWSLSKKPIVTVQDLICFIMELLHKFHDCAVASKWPVLFSVDAPGESKWTSTEVDQVSSAMLRILQAADRSKWITWRDLKGAMPFSKDPELVDFVLKALEGKVLASRVVQCRRMFSTRTLEYRLEDIGSTAIESDNESVGSTWQSMQECVLEDLKMIYHALLQPLPAAALWHYGLGKQFADASRKLLDCKQFAKDYEAKHPIVMKDFCQIRVIAVAEILDEPKTAERPPPELLVLPQNATVADLKQEIVEAFKDVYICFKWFQVHNIPELQGREDSVNLMFLLGPESVVTVQGCFSGNVSMFRTERGDQIWTVKCSCGASEDDGELMIQCDKCQVWQHTRCVGILDTKGVPQTFICKECNEILSGTSCHSGHNMLGSSSV